MRNKILSLLGVVLAGLFFTGCAAFQTSTTQISPKVTGEKPTAEKALIVVEGSDSWAGMIKLYACAVFDNQTPVGKVGPHGKLKWLRDPGPMELKLKPGAGRYLTVAAGESYQFKVNCDSSLIYAFAGPGIPVNQLPKENAVHIKQAIETALGTNNCVRRIEVFAASPPSDTSKVFITLNVAAANEEKDCRKAMQALARDQIVPLQDEVYVFSAHTSASKKAGAIFGALVWGGLIGCGVESFSDSNPSTEDVTYACVITRDALMQGREPESVKQYEKLSKP